MSCNSGMPPLQSIPMRHIGLFFAVVSSFVVGCAEGTTFPIGAGGMGGVSVSSSSADSSSASSSSSSSTGMSSSSSGAGGAGGAGGSGGSGGLGGTAGAAGSGGTGGASCPPGEFITRIDVNGDLVCSGIDMLTKNAFDSNCRIHLGWSDQCGACTTPPSKWGSVSPSYCNTGIGANNTCQNVIIGGKQVQLLGLNMDGDVDTNDKLYARFSCDAKPLIESAEPCDPGELAVGYNMGALSCGNATAGILDALRDHCQVTVGARDSCDGCTDPPLQWGQASTLQCNVGGGASTTCQMATLGGDTMNLLGVDFEGDVDGNDKLYMGLGCSNSTTMPALGVAKCPAGQYATGINAEGQLDCAPVDALAIAYFQNHCNIYVGWTDACNGCLGVPTKWGFTSSAACQNGAGLDDSCTVATLGTDMVRLFGINFDGDVNDDDTIFVGLYCE